MQEFRDQGATILLVSHAWRSFANVSACSLAGSWAVEAVGKPEAVIHAYRQSQT